MATKHEWLGRRPVKRRSVRLVLDAVAVAVAARAALVLCAPALRSGTQ